MAAELWAVFLSFVLYLLYITIPMLPAILIYKKFPGTKVGLSGPLANLTINATGAFAAYVITVSLGFPLVNTTHNLITELSANHCKSWLVKAEVRLVDKSNQDVTTPGKLKSMQVLINPKLHENIDEYVTMKIPVQGETWQHSFITFHIPKFGEETIDLTSLDDKSMKKDKFQQVLTILKPVVIHESSEYKEAPIHIKAASLPNVGPPPAGRTKNED